MGKGDTNIQSITHANMMPQWRKETEKRGEDCNSEVLEEASQTESSPKVEEITCIKADSSSMATQGKAEHTGTDVGRQG